LRNEDGNFSARPVVLQKTIYSPKKREEEEEKDIVEEHAKLVQQLDDIRKEREKLQSSHSQG